MWYIYVDELASIFTFFTFNVLKERESFNFFCHVVTKQKMYSKDIFTQF